MKFVHIADMHFDRTFDSLANVEGLSEKRRLDQRLIFKKIIEYVKQNNIELLFIAGDFYEQNTIRKTTIDFINNSFKEINNTKIIITPGNHDPLLKNSYYNTYEWNKNVNIFNSKLEKIELKNIDIYGYGFEDFYEENNELETFQLNNKNKINILITHASLDASKTIDLKYNPIKTKTLEEIGFDYIALGHIHKTNYEKSKKIIYPGSTIAQGFDELGEHGMVVGNIDIENKTIKTEFIKLDDTEFCEQEIDIENIFSEEELIEKINNLKLIDKNLYKIILTGRKNFNIEEKKIEKLINKENILKIKNITKIKFDIEKIAEEESLRGYFIKECLEKLKQTENKEIIEEAISFGLEAFENQMKSI